MVLLLLPLDFYQPQEDDLATEDFLSPSFNLKEVI
jgi:hypothetical protein